MFDIVKLYALTALVFFAIDLVWLGVVASSFYQRHLGDFLAPQARWAPAIVFYLIFVAGIVTFAILPGLTAGSLPKALALGAFLGLVCYATFDLTCYALFRDFPGVVVAVDLVWGMGVSTVVTAAGYFIGRWLGIGS